MRDDMPAFEIHNKGTINIVRGRPAKNHKESLSTPISVRLYENEKKLIQERQFQFDLSRNEVIQKCVQVGTFAFEYLDWIKNNMDTISVLAKRYNRKNRSV